MQSQSETETKTQSKPLSRKCQHCGKPLKAIGLERANGKPGRKGAFNDWGTRKYHKKCYKELMRQRHYDYCSQFQ